MTPAGTALKGVQTWNDNTIVEVAQQLYCCIARILWLYIFSQGAWMWNKVQGLKHVLSVGAETYRASYPYQKPRKSAKLVDVRARRSLLLVESLPRPQGFWGWGRYIGLGNLSRATPLLLTSQKHTHISWSGSPPYSLFPTRSPGCHTQSASFVILWALYKTNFHLIPFRLKWIVRGICALQCACTCLHVCECCLYAVCTIYMSWCGALR